MPSLQTDDLSRLWPALLLAVGAGAGALLALTDGNMLIVLAPLGAALGYLALRRQSYHSLALIFLFVALLVDDTRTSPHMGMWQSPLTKIGFFVYDALEKTLRIPGLKLFGLELLLLGVLAAFWLQTDFGKRVPAPARAMRAASLAMLLMVLVWEVWGILRGGHINYSMLQMRPMVLFGLATWLFSYAFYYPRAPKHLFVVLLVVGCVRALVGVYFWRAHLASGAPIDVGGGVYVTTHQDSVLWATGLCMCVAWLFEQPNRRAWLVTSALGGLLLFGMVINNRRLAFISLALSFMTMYVMAMGGFRRRVNRLLLLGLLISPMYLAAGWNSQAMWAKPIRTFKSVFEKSDSSAEMRDIENYNLLITFKQQPIFGAGFGHEYIEFVRAYSIEDQLQAYLYLPHNSLMWLLTAGGIVGFTLFWSFLLVGVFLSMRTYRLATEVFDKVLAMGAISAAIAYMIQAFGDLGVQSWMSSLIVAALFGAVAARSAMLGAWPVSYGST